MQHLAPLIYDLAIMLGLAGIVVLLFQRIRQPVVLGYLVAGMIIGPYTPPYAFVNDIDNIKILSELGVIFLMFSLGLEFSFKKLTHVGFSAGVIGVIEVIFMIAIGYGVGLLIGWSHYDSLFLGAALSISSTTIIIKAIDELGLKTKRFAELIFGVLIVEDLLAILLLVALSTIVTTNQLFSYDMLSATVKLILVVGGWFLFGYFLVPPVFRRIAGYISQETLTIISVALCLCLVCIAAEFGYSVALGAFIMGSILAETTLIHRIEDLIRPIRDIFAAVFFISVGMLIDPVVIIQYWPVVLLLSLVTVFGKTITTSIAAILTGQSVNTSVRVGFSMAQVGEFSFIIAALGLSLHVTSNNLYPLIVAVSAVTTFTTPYLIRLSGQISVVLEKHMSERTKYFLKNYSAWVYRTQTMSKKQSIYRTATIRLIANGIMVAIIFTSLDQIFLPKLEFFRNETWWTNTVSLWISLIISSPFIWGMMFSYKRANVVGYAKTNLNPAIFIIWLLTLAEITTLGFVLFQGWVTVLMFSSIAIIFFVIAYKQLEKSYRWFEQQLVSNISSPDNETNQSRYEELAPWDTHLVEVEVGEQSTFVGRTLGDIHVRRNYGVNIVAISHGSRSIPAPRGEEVIAAHDKLIVLGNDAQIDAFRQQVEVIEHKKEKVSFLEAFKLKAFHLEHNHPLVGKSIRLSNIRESVNGLVVGLERDNTRILNPSSDTILQAEDLLLIVGEIDKIRQLNIENLH